jgi:hypothetical protein
MSALRDKRWEPALVGEKYCSPACGGGCTKEAHDRAQERAAALAWQLGEGWRPRVWENLGWHHSATDKSGKLKVHPSDVDGSFFALFGDGDGGEWRGNGETPEAAVKAAVAAAIREVRRVAGLLEAIS